MPKPLPSGADLQKLQSDAIEFAGTAATKTIDGFRRLAELNMQTTRASLEQSSEQIHALLEARDSETLSALVTSLTMLSPEKFSAYANAVYAIAHETGVDIGSLVEKQITRSNEQLASAVEALAQSAPGGTAGTVDFIRQSMEAARAAYEQMQQAAAQATGQTWRKDGKNGGT